VNRLPSLPCVVAGCPRTATMRSRCSEHHKAYERGRSRDRRFYLSPRWRLVRAAQLAAHPRCKDCGAVATEVDHVLSRRRGGTDDFENLASMCKPCHSRKTAMSGERWG
jgi:5-methylcytosine-specific restriction protein A